MTGPLPEVGDVVTVHGIPGRFRVREVEPERVVLVRAGRVEILYSTEIELIQIADVSVR